MTPALPLLLACSTGRLAWPDDVAPLRTALVQETVDAGIPKLSVVLSSSAFPCDLPTSPDPVEQAQALLDLQAAACREGAEHVLLQLWRGEGTTWTATYEGDGEASALTISADRPRLADATWYGIDEAALAGTSDFVRRYGVALGGSHRLEHFAAGGEVEITADDGTAGRFSFPDVGLEGRFAAEVCAPGATLFSVLASSPVAGCPVVAP